MGLVLFDFEMSATARAERTHGVWLDDCSRGDLEWACTCCSGFEFEQLLPRASERLAQHTGTQIHRRSLRFEAGHDERGAMPRRFNFFNHAMALFKGQA